MKGKHHDLVNFTHKYKAARHEFFLGMSSWKKFKCRYRLTWEKVRFREDTRGAVPNVRGVYAFTVELSPTKLPQHGYILYVGITGDDSKQNLSSRYAQYLAHLKNADGRPAVYFMLKNWSPDLFFNFVAIPNVKVDLARIEREMISAIIPPVNKRDFDGEIAAAKAAAF